MIDSSHTVSSHTNLNPSKNLAPPHISINLNLLLSSLSSPFLYNPPTNQSSASRSIYTPYPILHTPSLIQSKSKPLISISKIGKSRDETHSSQPTNHHPPSETAGRLGDRLFGARLLLGVCSFRPADSCYACYACWIVTFFIHSLQCIEVMVRRAWRRGMGRWIINPQGLAGLTSEDHEVQYQPPTPCRDFR